MKRLRKKYGNFIRYFHCGEYGDLTRRPHYHAIIFNHDFSDKILHSESNGIRLYTSAILEQIWGNGICTVGDVTFESAAYVARYVLKKINGDEAENHYRNLIIETGELYPIVPEYITMSLKPGIGSRWYQKFKTDMYPSDELIMRGLRLKPPKYYDKIYDIENPKSMAKIKGRRRRLQKLQKADQTPERLAVRLVVKKAQISTLKRKL